ncbi:hypothetical protein [Massilia sp. TWP1-3-3]|uniref:hypothetical protein n=1 Tax=Massilia sp. TWP1-3-3 TaxID=2804573 RepID=UPI003CECCBA7
MDHGVSTSAQWPVRRPPRFGLSALHGSRVLSSSGISQRISTIDRAAYTFNLN